MLINTFKTDYKMGSVRTATEGAKIFVFLAQQAGISLSHQILENLSVSSKKSMKISDGGKTRKPKTDKDSEPEDVAENSQKKLPEEILASLTVRNVGYVYINDKDSFELAKGYMKLLAKKLGIEES